jgi:hypothetical protein
VVAARVGDDELARVLHEMVGADGGLCEKCRGCEEGFVPQELRALGGVFREIA